MFKSQDDHVTVLGVCIDAPALVGLVGGLAYHPARSGRRAIDLLRAGPFDLVLVGLRLPDANAWDFVRRLRTGFAWQKWALVGGPGTAGTAVTDDQERTARLFGSACVYDVTPTTHEVLALASALRHRAALAVLNRTFDRPSPLTPGGRTPVSTAPALPVTTSGTARPDSLPSPLVI